MIETQEDRGGAIRRPLSPMILGTKVDSVGREEALERVLDMIRGSGHSTVYPVNPEMIMRAQHDDEFREALNCASMGTPDGVGIVMAARLLGLPIRQRVAGIDLAMMIVEHCAREGRRLFLLGAADGIAERVAEILSKRFPGLRVAGTYAGSPHAKEEQHICDLIRGAQAEVLFVAYGAPKQELWIHRNVGKTGVRVAMAVGGSFDFIAGVKRRAPKFMQSLGIEWLYRLFQEPWRWKRMLALPRFAVAVMRQKSTSRRSHVQNIWSGEISESHNNE